ncbi:MAG TPA: glutathione peroxidase [Bacteroidia bacterium]|jgi:glutathione peroxidase|nr:glutathione peroxidase [Bacteroidia bacterium]
MTLRQFVIKHIYPLLQKRLKTEKTSLALSNDKNVQPHASFYNLKTTSIKGEQINFESFKGKKVLLVNTASDCGFTPQFTGLQKLHEQFGQQVIVLGFPANDFKEQEKHGDTEIATFCQANYGVTFTMMKKSGVIKNENQNEVYNWLTNATLNGWNNQAPVWNFSKYLVNEQGILTNYFGPSVNPTDAEVIKAIKA